MNNLNYKLLFFLIIISVSCKPKTELYLERGLDILSNKENVNFKIFNGFTIHEIGVIRDQKEGIKTLVFKIDEQSPFEELSKSNIIFGIRVWIIDDNDKKRIENWDFKPKITNVKDYKYVLREINIKENQIKKMKIYAYQNIEGKKHKIGSTIILHKVNTYND